jgi:hypothetical protein
VVHTLLFVYALHQHAQHLCSRVLTLACPAFLTVADIKGHVGATRAALSMTALRLNAGWRRAQFCAIDSNPLLRYIVSQ